MRSYPNIEKSAFRKGEYVGYCDGVWHIRPKARGGLWGATKRDSNEPTIFAETLGELSVKLTSLESESGAQPIIHTLRRI